MLYYPGYADRFPQRRLGACRDAAFRYRCFQPARQTSTNLCNTDDHPSWYRRTRFLCKFLLCHKGERHQFHPRDCRPIEQERRNDLPGQRKFLKIGSHETTIAFLNPRAQTEEETYRTALEIIGLFKLFRNIYEFDARIKGIYILGFNGNNISEQDGRYWLPGSLTGISTVRTILSRPGTVFYLPNERTDYSPSDSYRNVISVGTAIVRPVTRDVLGVIIVDVDRAAIAELCGNVKIGQTGYFSVISSDREYIFPAGRTISDDHLSAKNIDRIANNDRGYLIESMPNGDELFVFATLRSTGWKLVGRVNLREIMASAYQIRNTTLLVMFLTIAFTILLYFFISDALTHPIRDLKDKMKEAETGNLDVIANYTNRDEIADLSHSFNRMIAEIRELLARSIKEHEDRKKFELTALQAQINPHFLYNTLDAIVWMTEANKKAEVVRLTKALSSFFRISLSKGEEWIPVEDEIKHVRSYLLIQKMRHRDLLEYEICADDAILPYKVLKLTLQPVVENAIEHGIKNKRGGGTVRIDARISDGELLLEVNDDGIGMTPDRLQCVLRELSEGASESAHDGGYGLKNVHSRIRLYYGAEWGITLRSERGGGTQVLIRLPARK